MAAACKSRLTGLRSAAVSPARPQLRPRSPPAGRRGLAAHQVHVHVIIVVGIGAWRQHGGERLAGRAVDVAQEALLFEGAMPAVLHRDLAAIGQYESGQVERVAKGVLRDVGFGITVHPAAGIRRNLLDLGYWLPKTSTVKNGLFKLGRIWPAVTALDRRGEPH